MTGSLISLMLTVKPREKQLVCRFTEWTTQTKKHLDETAPLRAGLLMNVCTIYLLPFMLEGGKRKQWIGSMAWSHVQIWFLPKSRHSHHWSHSCSLVLQTVKVSELCSSHVSQEIKPRLILVHHKSSVRNDKNGSLFSNGCTMLSKQCLPYISWQVLHNPIFIVIFLSQDLYSAFKHL